MIRFNGVRSAGEVSGYRRELDLSTAVATSTWTSHDVAYQAEVFCSTAENVCVACFKTSAPGKLNCSIQLRREAGAVSRCLSNDTLLLQGQASHWGKHLGVKFAGVLKAVTVGGVCRPDADTLHVEGADEVILTLVAGTDLKRY